ncbi:hypothetical protein GCK72_012059 [Caenorhabditis remanei]|uniref:Uncharacterized protein n=1 Tax=Caenorhabditis remanei TaxID=31234 RepID=A0A6A5GMQ0_CAERE|nr:hypothetical protein GCK72_012059 [Caenorhabditis remanei]KAF1755609.1 hypothetical protein GCK72_012059 [Caenorhabditis remanei]
MKIAQKSIYFGRDDTAFAAASSKLLAVRIVSPDFFMISFAASTFVPSKRTTIGTFSPILFTAFTTPFAIVAQFTIPPKILMRTHLTRGSDVMILTALKTASSVTAPPTSRKFAGSPPCNLIKSIVAIASPAPFTRKINEFIKDF